MTRHEITTSTDTRKFMQNNIVQFVVNRSTNKGKPMSVEFNVILTNETCYRPCRRDVSIEQIRAIRDLATAALIELGEEV